MMTSTLCSDSARPAHHAPSQNTPLSVSTRLSHHQTALDEMSNRPTLPGIASILDFAGQHRPQHPAHSHSHSHSHSSDPLAHLLPALVPINNHPQPSYLPNAHNHNHNHHQLRPPSSTISQPSPVTLPTHLRQLTHPQTIRKPRSTDTTTTTTPKTSPPARSVRDLCHPSHQPVRNKEAYHSTSDRPSSSFVPPSNPTTPSLTNHHQTSTRHMTDDLLQQPPYSERNPPPQLPPHHPLRAQPSPPPKQYQPATDDHRTYTHHHHHQHRHPPRRESYDSLAFNHRPSASQSYDSSPTHQSVSPDIHPLSKIAGSLNNSSVSSLGPQHRYQCMEPGCAKTFSRPSSLKIHSYSHTGQKPFKCMRCDRAFSVQSNLKRHQKVHEKRSIGGPVGRPVSTHSGGGGHMAMAYERGASGRLLVEEESGDDEHGGSEHGTYDRMEE